MLDFLVSFAFTTTVIAMIYKIIPRAKVVWADVWIGAAGPADYSQTTKKQPDKLMIETKRAAEKEELGKKKKNG